MTKPVNTIILAAGKGTRMQSSLPKVLQPLSDKPLLEHVLLAAQQVSQQTYTVVGFEAETVKKAFADKQTKWVHQDKQLGTGHAVLQALKHIQTPSVALVLYGDVPLIKTKTLKKLIKKAQENTLALLSVELKNPTGYGRIIRKNNKIVAIVEHKDATEAQKKITEVNTGILALDSELLNQYLQNIQPNNAQGELYLTDVIELATQAGLDISSLLAVDEFEVFGVNDKQQLGELERVFQLRQAQQMMRQGLQIRDAHRFDCRGLLTFGKDCEIDINTVFIGNVTLGDGVKILPNCVIENAQICSHAVIGPFARIRPESVIGEKVKIGNFVGVKKSTIGAQSKVSHLSYIGDSTIGKKVNIGAGVITCNYDGVNKHQTTIEDNVFIGSSSQLIAPITLKEGSTIGAGSTLTKDTPKNTLTLSRNRQISLKNWKKPTRD
jgi:bifunctional UDP-N-acetylglucosamine pyrophosphorylase/glucosamine-1-phosphate N-acetyltransferase